MTRIRRPLGRLGLGLGLIAIVASGLALVQNRVLWGFWFARPSLAVELDNSIILHGVSGFDVLPSRVAVPSRATRERLIAAASKACSADNRDRESYCTWGRLLLQLTGRATPLEQVPEVDPALLQTIWTQYGAEGWQPRVEPRYPGSEYLGVAIHFRKFAQEHVILAYETLEIAGDRHAYAEALYRLGEPQPSLLRENRLFFEVAGAEGWETLLLAVVNLILIVPGAFVLTLAQRKVTRISLTALVLASLLLFGVAAWVLGVTWGPGTGQWRTVGVIWACLLGGSALVAIVVVGLRARRRASRPTVGA